MTHVQLRKRLSQGLVIPAHPLALDSGRKLDERRQRALSRYYQEAGAGGLAVGVHTTQFAIHSPGVGLYRPVLELVREEVGRFSRRGMLQPLLVAGIVGDTRHALEEAILARELGYDCGLLSLAALPRASDSELLEHVGRVAEVLPLFAFYLQPAVGGRRLSFSFWRTLMEVDSLVAVKVAPFDRYATLDVVRAVAESGRDEEVILYTGNDDNILVDLATPYRFAGRTELRIRGGLLGQWAVWTRRAVELLGSVKGGEFELEGLLDWNARWTDANAAIFDAANGFRGCIPGIHEILRRQGLLEGRWTLDPAETLSEGQMEAIDRICELYPELADDDFVAENLDRWMSG